MPHPIELVTVHIQVLWNLIFGGKSFLNSFRGCVYYSDLAVGGEVGGNMAKSHNVYASMWVMTFMDLQNAQRMIVNMSDI